MLSLQDDNQAVKDPGQRPAVVEVAGLNAWYGDSHILQGVDINMYEGELVALLGKNGAGKTTTLRSIMGAGPRTAGTINVRGRPARGQRPEVIARMGIAYCPEERAILSSLTVEENLFLPPVIAPGGLSTEEIFRLFPNLASRLASQGSKLSGGEQQMLAIARILRTGAKILLLDEPTEGLAPVIVEQIANTIAILRQKGFTILLVEQNFTFALSVADRIYLMEHGRTVDTIDAAQAAREPEKLRQWLSV